MFCWPCISIHLCNKNQLDALFILSLFRQSICTCFGHICSPSSGGILYIYNNTYQLLCIYSIPPDDGRQICPKHVEVDWNKLRINSGSGWYSLHGGIISWNCIMDRKTTKLKGTLNIRKEFGKIYCDSGRYTGLTENRVWSIELSGLELACFGVLKRRWRTLRNTYNVQVNKHRKDSRRYLSITNFKLLLYIFLPVEGTIQSCCSLYNESLYCQCKAVFHWTRRLHVTADCHCSVLDATLDTFQQPYPHGEMNLSYLLTECMADGWLEKLLRICLIAEPWTDRQFGS